MNDLLNIFFKFSKIRTIKNNSSTIDAELDLSVFFLFGKSLVMFRGP